MTKNKEVEIKNFVEGKAWTENKEKCNCLCHDNKHLTAIGQKEGLIHDTLCCDKMNGSLMNYGLQNLLAETKAEERKRLLERLPEFLFTSSDESKEIQEGIRGHNQMIAWERCLKEIKKLLK